MILDLEKVQQLKPNSNKKLLAMCDDCKGTFSRQFQLLNRQKEHRCYPCARKHIGKTMNREKINAATRDRRGDKHPRWNPQLKEYKKYCGRVHYLTMKTYRKYKDVINPNGYPRTLCGVEGGYQLDHKIPIKEGFIKRIPEEVVADVLNLQIIPWKENRSKGFKLGV